MPVPQAKYDDVDLQSRGLLAAEWKNAECVGALTVAALRAEEPRTVMHVPQRKLRESFGLKGTATAN